ncbi:MAG: SDR family oxidoreductase [Neomegalonema sp.]|nr:SDR family oxidoreductase [Neomegalonema sp.]
MLDGRKILVTGSHSGIGFAIAQAAAAAGAEVAIHARRAVDLGSAEQRFGGSVVSVLGDLADPQTPARMVDEAASKLGGLDGVVNNAALLSRSTLGEETAEHLDAMMAVNLRAPILLTQAAVPHLEARPGGGAVVNIGSINAYCGAPNLLAYSASKAALATATRNIADGALGAHFRINQINVGWTLTESEMRLQREEGRSDDWLDRVPPEFAPRGAILQPEEVASHVVFWLSDRSAPANGQVYELEQYPVIGRNRISLRG